MVRLSYTKGLGAIRAAVPIVLVSMGTVFFAMTECAAATVHDNKQVAATASSAGVAAATASSTAVVTAVTHSAASAQTTADTQTGNIPQSVSSTCMACHGMTGISPQGAMFPDLAGQWAPYLVKQLDNFRSHTRADPMAKAIMWGMAASLTPAQVQHVADYYSKQVPAKGKMVNQKLAAAGKKIFEGGISNKQVPACMACHGPTGLGDPPLFPRLAGQRQAYVVLQLNYFKKGLRTNDPHAIMRYVASRLSEAQITELATYVRSLPGGTNE
ncbi:c-type cytochrome [Acidithiobacillus sp. MC6.1]|nr:c-type cytochrome [Acidithiobacillus sp. MC6.1]